MAMTIVETTRLVTGGVDTHLDVHVAAAVDASGGVLGVRVVRDDAGGLSTSCGCGWRRSARSERVGVEGTGAYGAGLARYLRGCELEVIEVDRPNRQLRRRAGKSDTVDAVEAARAALSRRASGIAKTADGNVEAIRVLLIAKRSARDTRIKCLNQIRHLGFTGPDELRERLRDVPRARLARTAAGLRPTVGSDPVMYATKLALQTLGRRVVDLDTTTQRLDATARAARACHRTRPRRGRLVSGSTPRRSCWSLRATTPNGSDQKQRSRTCVASHPSKRHRARPSVIVSTGAGTDKRTTRCGGSCSPA